jgi:hypothetical protein
MVKENTLLRILIVVLSLTSLSALAVWNRTNQDNIKLRSRIETLREEKYKLIDSCENLKTDLFNAQNEIGIEELVLDSLFTKYPKLQKEHNHIKNESNLFE